MLALKSEVKELVLYLVWFSLVKLLTTFKNFKDSHYILSGSFSKGRAVTVNKKNLGCFSTLLEGAVTKTLNLIESCLSLTCWACLLCWAKKNLNPKKKILKIFKIK